jgi:restriction system protein
VKFELHHNSLFAVLLRSSWWISGLLAVGIFGATRLFLPAEFAVFAAAPFIVITLYVAWKQLRAPSAKRIAATLERVRAMSWDELSAAIEEAFRRDGYTVTRLRSERPAGADFELVQGSRSTLLACKRWKATRTGIEPLRELEAARHAREAAECIYVAAGEVTAQARAFAEEHKIRVMEGVELAKKIGVNKIGVRPL